MNGLCRVGGAFWGLRFPATITIYKGVVEAILKYASPFWFRNLTQRQRKRLASTQRTALLRVTRAYRSTSHEAVQVLAGVVPLDLLLLEEVTKYAYKREGSAVLSEHTRMRIIENPSKWKRIIREETVQVWNQRWVATPKGSTLRKYFPTVQSRLQANWILPDYWISQFLTGHGGFRAKLHSLGQDIDPQCPTCGVPETAEHVVTTCTAFDTLRATLMRATGIYILTEEEFPQLVSEENFPWFRKFIYEWKAGIGPAHFNIGVRRRRRVREPRPRQMIEN